MKNIGILLCAVFLFQPLAVAEVKTQEIDYQDGNTRFKGYLAYDDVVATQRPAILIVHEWWGHNEYVRKRARMLAELGYVGFAIDMYGDGKHADHPDQAAAFMKAVTDNEVLARTRFGTAYEILKSFSLTDTNRIGAIGYCFGGATVLKAALANTPLLGVVSFHGALALPSKLPAPGEVKTKILVCHGGDDQLIPPEQIASFKKAMDEAKVDYVFNVYPGAKHSFTNPDADEYAKKFGMPVAYSEAADKESWADMQDFFKKLFSK